MGFIDQFTRYTTACLQLSDDDFNTAVLLDDVQCAAREYFGKVGLVYFRDRSGGEVFQFRKSFPEQSQRLLTLRATRVELRSAQRAHCGGVEYQHALLHRHCLRFERVTPDVKRAAPFAQRGSKLIHDSGIDADELVLRAPTNEGELLFVEVALRDAAQRETCGNLERRRRAEARANGDVAGNDCVKLRSSDSIGFDFCADPSHVIPPCTSSRRGSDIELTCARFRARNDSAAFGVRPRAYRDISPPIDRDRQHLSAVVIRVFADDVHSARRRRKDRKSTRLNSSHVEISYAVFCLKKKKTMKTIRSNRDELTHGVDRTKKKTCICITYFRHLFSYMALQLV